MDLYTRGPATARPATRTSKAGHRDSRDSDKENDDAPSQRHGGGTPGSAGRKRTHQERDSTLKDDYGSTDVLLADGEHCSTPKRSRNSEWPLKNGVDINIGIDGATTKKASPNRNQHSSGQTVKKSKKGRKSLFKEGSLNDKPSKRPPVEIVGDEVIGLTTVETNHEKKAEQPPMHDGKDTGKPGGVFRFGKAIASVLNPVSIWQGMWKEKEHSYADLHPTQQEQARQEEIDKAYNRLRDSGYKGVKPSAPRSSIDITKESMEESTRKRNSFRDSGIAMSESSSRPSEDTKKPHVNSLQIPAQAQRACSTSPAPAALAAKRRSFSQLRSTSSSNLKKVRSHINIPTPRKINPSIKNIPSIDAVLASDAALDTMKMRGLPKKPSKKDIAKSSKLDKKVSDLEARLEAARAERLDYQNFLGSVPQPDASAMKRGRKAFVPGALDSLPSERLLNQRLEKSEHDVIVDTVPHEQSGKKEKSLPPTPVEKVGSWLDLSPRKRDAGNTPQKPTARRSAKQGEAGQIAEQASNQPNLSGRAGRRRSGRISGNGITKQKPSETKIDKVRRSGKGWVEFFDGAADSNEQNVSAQSKKKGKPAPRAPKNSPAQQQKQENVPPMPNATRNGNRTNGNVEGLQSSNFPPMGLFPSPRQHNPGYSADLPSISSSTLAQRIADYPSPDTDPNTITDPNNPSQRSPNSTESPPYDHYRLPKSASRKPVLSDPNARVHKNRSTTKRQSTSPRGVAGGASSASRRGRSNTVKSPVSLTSSAGIVDDNVPPGGHKKQSLRDRRAGNLADNIGNAASDDDDDEHNNRYAPQEPTLSQVYSDNATSPLSSVPSFHLDGAEGGGQGVKALSPIPTPATSSDPKPKPEMKIKRKELKRKSTSRDLRNGAGADNVGESASAKGKRVRGEKGADGCANGEAYVWEDQDIF